MRILTSLLLTAIFSCQAFAADVQEAFGMAAYYQFKTSDAAAIVPAMRAFSASECRKNMPAQLRLMSEHFNGDDDTTHTMIYGFANPQDMQTSYQVQGACPEFARLWSVLSKHTTPTAQSLGMTVVGGGDASKDGVYQIWQMKITDEAKYVKAYTKLMSDMEKAGLVRGAWGLVRFSAGSNQDYTHFAFSGSPDLATHVTPQDQTLYAKFSQAVAGVREIYRVNMNSVVADL